MVIYIIIGIIVFVVVLAVVFKPKGPQLKDLKHLTEPRIITKEKIKVICVEIQGDPNQSMGAAFGHLYKAFFQLKKNHKELKMMAPIGRWSNYNNQGENEDMSKLSGQIAFPVPDSVNEDELKNLKNLDPDKVKLKIWEYGRTAEILHVGPYNEEKPTIDKLLKFIEDSHLKINGDHEEEYVKGPGMIPMGNPKKYLTIIRYPVK